MVVTSDRTVRGAAGCGARKQSLKARALHVTSADNQALRGVGQRSC